MVEINVAQQLKEPIGSIRNYRVNDTVEIAGSDSPVHGEVRLMRTDRGILAKGTIHAEIELTCGRCLSPFHCPLNLHIEEEYFPTIDVLTGSRLTLPDEPDRFTINERNILDLTEAIRQYALLTIPIKPLCRQDCAGLCPGCGQNLNQSPCNCPPKSVDPRWSTLSKLISVNEQTLVNMQKGTN